MLALAGVLGTSAAGVAEAAPPLEWKSCGGALPVEMECATLDVPVDWEGPQGRKIALELARAKATGARAGAVVLNPGGPGNSGTGALSRSLAHFTELRRQFDVVTWNPRGGGATRDLPEVCYRTGPRFETPRTRDEFDRVVREGRAAVDRCRAADRELVDHVDSRTNARDLDAIRAALGEPELNYLGNSYGGVIGASYARVFPGRVRTMFLDSIVDHVSDFEVVERQQYQQSERAFAGLADWCATTPSCKQHGQDLGAAWRALLAAADLSPIPARGSVPQATYDGDRLVFAGSVLALNPELWQKFSDALEQARNGDAALFHEYAGGRQPMAPSAGVAMECADGVAFRDYEDYEAALARGAELSPNFPGLYATRELMCTSWTGPVANPRGPLPPGLPPMFGTGGWREFESVQNVLSQVPGSVGVKFDGPQHGLYLNEADKCVIGHADRYFTDRALPPAGTACPG
ncbi:alpha/beta fold hydrolase [Saccharopolyspora erythraea]|uniref:alpha/beta fold hydrolase n=1 Tax=Saccharopolyspora erythraea TaxID=1836 RepID=UPI002011FBE6|nr:alpha/beta fold hydrolase [Saccharopolyspora erythraea]